MSKRSDLKPIFRKWPRWALKIMACLMALVLFIPVAVQTLWPELVRELRNIDRMDD